MALAVALVVVIMIINLRGVKESGKHLRHADLLLHRHDVRHRRHRRSSAISTGTLGRVPDPPPLEPHRRDAGASPLFLLLHAFSSGTTALTGVEAISNGITAFKEPRSRNAGITLLWMACILGDAVPRHQLPRGARSEPCRSETETVISQLARTVFGGRGLLYLAAIGATTLILVMAANTAYADFPRLSALQAADGFLPRQLTYRGSRLVYSRGIMVLGRHRVAR